jgi:hypothetical protein
MPSLHLGWNLLIAVALIRESRHLAVRIAGWLTPAAMFLAMVMTANHYILDGVAGVVIVALALIAVEGMWLPQRLRPHRPTATATDEERPRRAR